MNALREPDSEASRRIPRRRSASPEAQRQPAEHQCDDREPDPVVKRVKHEISRARPLTDQVNAMGAHDGPLVAYCVSTKPATSQCNAICVRV